MRPEAWQVFADTVLQREALLCRAGDGRVPNDLAGLYVDGAEADRILRTLPGLDGPDRVTADQLHDTLRPALDAAREAFAGSLAGSSPFADVVRSADLDQADAEVLAVLCAVELSPHRSRLVAYVQDSVQLPRPTLATLARLLPGGAARLAPGGPLRRAELVTVAADGPWANWQCAPAERLVWALTGATATEPQLPAGAVVRAGTRVGGGPVLLVSGGDVDSRRQVVDRHRPGTGQLRTSMPATPAEWTAVVREATVGGLLVLLETDQGLDAAARDRLDAATHLAFAISTPAEPALESLPRRAWQEERATSAAADASAWEKAFGVPPDPAYRLNPTQLRLVAAASDGSPARLSDGVRRLAGGHLDGLAVRVRPRRGWADLVLAPDKGRQLHELAARCRRRATVYQQWGFPDVPSTGVVAMFSGPSGTGKTLAAEVVAGALGLDLYKVDLSAVVSKYIGETEKNLERIFGAAAAGDLVLFFDEADALFGKRSEVSDAHDRYANIEVAYLLQRLEAYDGLIVLATNLQRNIDQAFLRRIAVAVDFESPSEPQRRAMWARAFPPRTPVEGLDLDFLARQFPVTGGIIHNAALTAAFLAADEQAPVTMERIAHALKREFQKNGRLRTAAEFDRYFDLVTGDHGAEPAR